MRLGIVRGHVTLAPALPELTGKTFVILEPITAENLAAHNSLGGGKALVAVDALGAATGQTVAFTEGREAANPFWPTSVPIDAYCSLIVDSMSLLPQQAQTSEVQQ